jgi:hypothetical protein
MLDLPANVLGAASSSNKQNNEEVPSTSNIDIDSRHATIVQSEQARSDSLHHPFTEQRGAEDSEVAARSASLVKNSTNAKLSSIQHQSQNALAVAESVSGGQQQKSLITVEQHMKHHITMEPS